MKMLTAARNVVNTDEIVAWLNRIAERYPALTLWIGGPVRKWVNKNAPTKPFVAEDTTGMPDWLKKAMDSGAPAESVILDEALEQRIIPVLDYMTELLATKPDTNVASIGFDVAEKRSIEWHDKMAREAQIITPIPEDGAVIVKDYGNGWTWRRLEGKECLINEGNAMGHCVGRFGYYERIIRDKVDIFSLRDPSNVPHVTIEANLKDKSIQQIKGRGNDDVVAKYLPMVRSFLADYEWDNVSFDGAHSIRDDIVNDQRANRKPVIVYQNLKILQVPRDHHLGYEIYSDDTYIGKISVRKDKSIHSIDVMLSDRVCELLARAIIQEKWVRSGTASLQWLVTQQHLKLNVWSKLNATVYKEASQVAFFDSRKVDWVYTGEEGGMEVFLAGYDSSTKTTFINQLLVRESRALEIALELAEPQEFVESRIWGETSGTVMRDVQDRVRKLQAGRSMVRTDGDEVALNTMMTALKQPDVAAIKAAYLKAKSKSEVTDGLMKSLGMPTSGRAINGISTVLMCTLPIKNMAPFRKFVFNKPSLMTCWSEVLTKPDHLLASLKQYGLDEDAIDYIVILLRNEFLRLVPKPNELEELELDTPIANKVKAVMKWAVGHRQDAPRSKKLWGQV